MNENRTQYYLIRDALLGKKENGRYWLFTQGKWEHDTNNIIMDTIWGFDPSEPSDSPLRLLRLGHGRHRKHQRTAGRSHHPRKNRERNPLT